MWARQLLNANASYQILTIGDSTHINDNRFLITKSTVNNVRKTLIIDLKSGKIDFTEFHTEKKKNREIVLQGDFSLKKGVNFTEILNDLDSEEQNSGIFALW